jgi:hypothetical protein
MDKISSCPCAGARPEDAIRRDNVRSSEEDNSLCAATAERDSEDVVVSIPAGKR